MEGTEICFPQLNTSCRKSMSPHYDSMLLYILLSSSSLITVFLNLLVIISICHFRDLHTSTNFLLLSLAVSDFLVGFLLIPGEILLLGECWYLGNFMCAFYIYVSFIITSSSVGNMVLISVDRYVAICDPLRYSISITPTRVKICVILCWACSVSYSSLILKDFLKQPDRYNSCDGECVIVINYTTGSVDLVVARTLGIVIVVFLVCYCPYYLPSLAGQDMSSEASYLSFLVFLLYCNSLLNPVIYAFFYPWFRKAVKLIVTLNILQSDSSEANIL
ncbi:trace amine-associated receptor 3-like [Diretmus argenteus]